MSGAPIRVFASPLLHALDVFRAAKVAGIFLRPALLAQFFGSFAASGVVADDLPRPGKLIGDEKIIADPTRTVTGSHPPVCTALLREGNSAGVFVPRQKE